MDYEAFLRQMEAGRSSSQQQPPTARAAAPPSAIGSSSPPTPSPWSRTSPPSTAGSSCWSSPPPLPPPQTTRFVFNCPPPGYVRQEQQQVRSDEEGPRLDRQPATVSTSARGTPRRTAMGTPAALATDQMDETSLYLRDMKLLDAARIGLGDRSPVTINIGPFTMPPPPLPRPADGPPGYLKAPPPHLPVRKPRPKMVYDHCSFCKNNGESEDFYRTHILKDDDGRVTCPVLYGYTCPICQASGPQAHTLKHCPESQGAMRVGAGATFARQTYLHPTNPQQCPSPVDDTMVLGNGNPALSPIGSERNARRQSESMSFTTPPRTPTSPAAVSSAESIVAHLPRFTRALKQQQAYLQIRLSTVPPETGARSRQVPNQRPNAPPS